MPVTSSSDRVRWPACPERHSVNVRHIRKALITYGMDTQVAYKWTRQNMDININGVKTECFRFLLRRTEVQWIGRGSLRKRSSFIDLVQDLVFHLGDGVHIQNLNRTGLDFYSILYQHCQSLREQHSGTFTMTKSQISGMWLEKGIRQLNRIRNIHSLIFQVKSDQKSLFSMPQVLKVVATTHGITWDVSIKERERIIIYNINVDNDMVRWI